MLSRAKVDPGSFTDRAEGLRGHLAWLRAVEPESVHMAEYAGVIARIDAARKAVLAGANDG